MSLEKLSKEERFRIKGLNAFIKNADAVADEEFKKLLGKQLGFVSSNQFDDYKYIFRAGFLSALQKITLKINESA